jgi:hypothetical protein
MEQKEHEERPEKLLREKIDIVRHLKLGVHPRASAILVALGERPATEFYMPDRGKAEKIMEKLQSIGLAAEVVKEVEGEPHAVRVGVAESPEVLQSLREALRKNNQKDIGRLMGIPSTALDAFSIGQMVSEEEQGTFESELPYIVEEFALSTGHAAQELEILKRWNKKIAEYAPELVEQMSDEKEASTHHEETIEEKA